MDSLLPGPQRYYGSYHRCAHLDQGAHQFRLGGEFRSRVPELGLFHGERGTFTFSGTQGPWSTNPTESDQAADPNALILADFLGGYLYRGSITRGNQQRDVYVNTFSGFVQDAWQASRNLTVNYGIRYDYEGSVHNGNKDLSIFDASKGNCLPGRWIDSVYPAIYTNVSPRVGFSWQPHTGTVIRGGVGLYFDTPNLNVFFSNNPGNGGAGGLQGNRPGPNPVLSIGVPAQVIVPGQLLASQSVDPAQACVVQDPTNYPEDPNFRPLRRVLGQSESP